MKQSHMEFYQNLKKQLSVQWLVGSFGWYYPKAVTDGQVKIDKHHRDPASKKPPKKLKAISTVTD